MTINLNLPFKKLLINIKCDYSSAIQFSLLELIPINPEIGFLNFLYMYMPASLSVPLCILFCAQNWNHAMQVSFNIF